jgi:ribosomal protein L20A (L18A)
MWNLAKTHRAKRSKIHIKTVQMVEKKKATRGQEGAG